MKKQKSNLTTYLLILVLLAGLSLLLYPSFSDYWNSFHQSRAIATYTEQVANMEQDRYEDYRSQAQRFNEQVYLRQRSGNPFLLEDQELADYEELLDVTGVGIMGYIQIPSLDVSLPIYHGTSDTVLQIAVGHLDWTSLPVGGESTHCVLSGHRGLPSAKLFTNLDKLSVGDTFLMQVLDEVLTYEVDQILIVEPHETQALMIEEGKDYCTLVTCTPYGINSHRLLVRGHRIETVEEAKAIRIPADAVQIEPLLVAPLLSLPILLILLIGLLIPKPRKHSGDDTDEII